MIVRDGRRVEHNLGPRRVTGGEVVWSLGTLMLRVTGEGHSAHPGVPTDDDHIIRQSHERETVLTEVVEL